MPRTLEDLKHSGATEYKKKREPTVDEIRKKWRRYLEWRKRRREVLGEIQDGYASRFLYEGRL